MARSLPGGASDVGAPTTHHAAATRTAPLITATVRRKRLVTGHRTTATILVLDYDFFFPTRNVRPSTTASRFPADPTLTLRVNLNLLARRLAPTATDGISPVTHDIGCLFLS